jgi:hypothetical protein
MKILVEEDILLVSTEEVEVEQKNGKGALRRAVEEEIDSESVFGNMVGFEIVISEIDWLKFVEHGNNTIWGLHMLTLLSAIRFSNTTLLQFTRISPAAMIAEKVQHF